MSRLFLLSVLGGDCQYLTCKNLGQLKYIVETHLVDGDFNRFCNRNIFNTNWDAFVHFVVRFSQFICISNSFSKVKALSTLRPNFFFQFFFFVNFISSSFREFLFLLLFFSFFGFFFYLLAFDFVSIISCF